MARWTAEVFVDSTVGSITASVEAATPSGAEQQIRRIYGPVQQIVNLREVRGGGGGSAPEPGGCGGVLLLILAAICIGVFAGGEKKNLPSTPPESLSQPKSRVVQSPAPVAAEEPQFRDYPTPPPSYCVTENFEPC